MKAILHNVTLMNHSICVSLSYFRYFQSLAWVIWLRCFQYFILRTLEADIEVIIVIPLEFYEFFLQNVIYFCIKKQD